MLRWLVRIVLVLVCLAAVIEVALPTIVEQRENTLFQKPPYHASDRARNLHRDLTIADLHADSLLWGRDLLHRNSYGHVDIPRLVEGNVTLQVFSLPTKSPRGLNIERNDDSTDNIRLMAVLELWPPDTWTSLTARALYQARRLHAMAQESAGRFTVIDNATELQTYLARRQRDKNLTAGLLSIEGAHALDGKLANLDALYRVGYRMMSPSHFFDNDIGGSSAGVQKTGLTDKGREWVRQMESGRMIIDLAHASPTTIDDVLSIATRPVVISHTGVKGTCSNNRNLTDDQIQAVAKNGGLIGIGFWDTATCGQDARAIVKAMRYVSDKIGVDHVALGSDFDGATAEPFDTTGLVQLTDAMLENGYSEQAIRSIMGENVIHFLEKNLPEK